MGSSHSFYCTLIYAFNESHKRLELWSDLKDLHTQEAWIMFGDFNCVMSTEERIGAPDRNTEIVDMCECMHLCGMEDIKSVGNFYTWNNKQQGAARVFSKIDRVMAADIKAYNDMSASQNAMHLNPSDLTLGDLELQAINEYKLKHQAYLDFLRKKEKLDWIKAGDENTALFHKTIRQRSALNQIYSIHDMHGVWKEDFVEVSKAFLEAILNALYTTDEVKKALFSIPGVKAPGPDGFGAFFFKDSWSIVGDKVISAILDMLQQGKLLKELNHIVITLIPKTKCPNNVSDFRPISCFNTLYKCVTKILYGRLRQILPDLIMENQGGFVHGRHIVHNIMVVQDLVKHCGRKDVKSSFLMKIDLQKEYDTVDWKFLQEMLEQLGFPKNFVHIVMECVTTPMFSLMINGFMQGFFKSQRDDLILCCKGEFASSYLMLQAFKLFSDTSSLHANKKKSSIYCYGMAETDVRRVDRDYSTKPRNISWENSCCNKKEGGLGFRDVIKWKTAMMGKYVWVAASKQDNVWIKWVNVVYIKDGVWWDYQRSASASWYWRKVCETKESLKHFYSQAEFSAISQYSVKAVYEKIIGARHLVNWDRLVWNPLNIPRHRFICWMVVQARLQTTTKLAKIGVSVSPLCLLCGQQDEDHKHLFFLVLIVISAYKVLKIGWVFLVHPMIYNRLLEELAIADTLSSGRKCGMQVWQQ
ncbi:uncharacterized protein [Spinacia oleracea]|uniref:Reverse transcriptase domain-containing protein n=1 Tax=Spinacia oleracea TaxID=3562 RepID=A0ABM3QVB0_SPIOL|nr:uncharacterized protein LOC130462626 [Spinacia oleracea]